MDEPPTILYIEDNLDNRILVKRILEAEGYVVLEAGDAMEGFRIARMECPSLVLVDINLPKVDGLTFTAHLRDDSSFDDTPIIAISADVVRGDQDRSISAGCDGYIQKPIDVDQLPSTINEFLKIVRNRQNVEVR
ncbi:MAG: response regulator [Anaerolineales bacterium]|nr:response regulator [Anaerolineales bacterium]